MGLAWLSLLSFSPARIRAFLARVQRELERIAGALLVALGIRLALERQ